MGKDFALNQIESEIKRSIPHISSMRDLKSLGLTRNLSVSRADFQRSYPS